MCISLAAWCKDLYRARLGDAGALAVYRAAHRPRVRRGRGEEEPGEEEDGEEEEAEGGEDGIVPAEDSATEQEGEAVFEGPALPPWLGIEAIFDNPQDEEEEEENEEEVEDMDSQKAFGSDLISAPSIASLESDSQPSSVHVIDVPNSPGKCSNIFYTMIVVLLVVSLNLYMCYLLP